MRIGINVPDELLERFKPVRDIINISQVCREAIEDWVETYEEAKSRAEKEGMDEVANRLYHQYREETPVVDWTALGYEDARMWAQLATLKDFEYYFEHNLGIVQKQGRKPGPWVARYIQGVKTFSDRAHENEAWFKRQIELGSVNLYLKAEEEYNRAWISYVMAVWHKMKERVMSEETKIERAQREKRDELRLAGLTSEEVPKLETTDQEYRG